MVIQARRVMRRNWLFGWPHGMVIPNGSTMLIALSGPGNFPVRSQRIPASNLTRRMVLLNIMLESCVTSSVPTAWGQRTTWREVRNHRDHLCRAAQSGRYLPTYRYGWAGWPYGQFSFGLRE